jgi:putative PIN family toxin of toxin-antitoxin system
VRRIVLDTNVLVSGLLNPLGRPARALDAIAAGRAIPLFDDRILSEYRRVLARRRFGLDPAKVEAWFRDFAEVGEPVVAIRRSLRLPDESDRPFIEVARTGRAEALVTGNSKHFPPETLPEVLIPSPASFLAWLEEQSH